MKDYNPPMHTTEHILNQTMISMFGCERSFSNHIERKKSKCDYHFERALTKEEEAALAESINEVIGQNLAVTVELVTREEAVSICSLERLPDSVSDEIRIVRVGDYDVCPCIGPHVCNTSEIGNFHLVSSSFENGVLRIRYKLVRS